MILNFGDRGTEDLFHGNDTKAARSIPRSIWKAAIVRLDALDGASARRISSLLLAIDSRHSEESCQDSTQFESMTNFASFSDGPTGMPEMLK